jgi:hypothetical protein
MHLVRSFGPFSVRGFRQQSDHTPSADGALPAVLRDHAGPGLCDPLGRRAATKRVETPARVNAPGTASPAAATAISLTGPTAASGMTGRPKVPHPLAGHGPLSDSKNRAKSRNDPASPVHALHCLHSVVGQPDRHFRPRADDGPPTRGRVHGPTTRPQPATAGSVPSPPPGQRPGARPHHRSDRPGRPRVGGEPIAGGASVAGGMAHLEGDADSGAGGRRARGVGPAAEAAVWTCKSMDVLYEVRCQFTTWPPPSTLLTFG